MYALFSFLVHPLTLRLSLGVGVLLIVAAPLFAFYKEYRTKRLTIALTFVALGTAPILNIWLTYGSLGIECPMVGGKLEFGMVLHCARQTSDGGERCLTSNQCEGYCTSDEVCSKYNEVCSSGPGFSEAC